MKHSIMMTLFWYYSPNMARRDWMGFSRLLKAAWFLAEVVRPLHVKCW